MVRKLLLSFNREISGIHQAALLLGVASIGAKVLALLRDRLLAGTFGAGEMLDIYFAAFRLPDLLYSLTLILTTSAAIIPIFMKKESQGHERAHRFVSQLSTMFFIAVSALIGISFFLMPIFAPIIAPGFSDDNLEALITLSRILLLSPLLLGFSILISNVLQSHRRFFIYAASPILYNAGIITGILVFYPWMGLSGLTWGVIFGALMHLSIQVPSLFALGFFPRPSFAISWKDVQEVLRFSLPRSVGFSQIVLIVVTAVASALGAGSISIFQLSYNLYAIPLGVIGLSYSVATFPALARSYAGGRSQEFVDNVATSLRHILFWATPFVVLFILLRAHIVRVILGAGAFGWVDTRLTAAALAFFSVAILAQSIVLLLTRAFYAAGRTLFPFVINTLSALVTIGFTFGLLWIMRSYGSIRAAIDSVLRVGDLPNTLILMLPFAYSVGSVMGALFLWIGFVRAFRTVDGKLQRSVMQNGAAALVLGVVIYGVLQLTDTLFNLETFLGIFLHGFFAGLLGITVSLSLLWFLKNQELFDIIRALRRKFWRSQVAAPEPRSPSEE
ncbi:hypothetical protein IIA95_03540 [Patescibacteria group bacterium]|nr:hypothetical protein [Patescibacteria group bacterium]